MDKVDRASGCGAVNIDLFIQIRAGALNFAGDQALGKNRDRAGRRDPAECCFMRFVYQGRVLQGPADCQFDLNTKLHYKLKSALKSSSRLQLFGLFINLKKQPQSRHKLPHNLKIHRSRPQSLTPPLSRTTSQECVPMCFQSIYRALKTDKNFCQKTIENCPS